MIALIGILWLGFGGPAFADVRTWEWTQFRYAPCRGVGATATARLGVRAEVVETNEGHEIRAFSLNVRSVARDMKLTGFLQVAGLSDAYPRIRLVHPWYSTIGDPETLTLVSPPVTPRDTRSPPKVVKVPKGATVTVTASMYVTRPTGTCALGEVTKTLDLDR